jgi:2-oxoglutarate ferredoxin oxidoreductase subunit beta
MIELKLSPHEITVVSGIGQSGKFPHYTKCNTFNGLHGRTLPVATAMKLVNHAMPVVAEAGDGDCYGEGGNHLLHAISRNIDVSLFVHDNQIYGLTKGQASPTSMEGMMTKINPHGVVCEPLNPMVFALALDCSFVARGYAGDPEHLAGLMKAAINHRGFALIDILQPCVTFNLLNTYGWFKQRIYRLEADYDPEDKEQALHKAAEFGDRIPIGIIYRNNCVPMNDRIPLLAPAPLVKQPFDPQEMAQTILNDFF